MDSWNCLISTLEIWATRASYPEEILLFYFSFLEFQTTLERYSFFLLSSEIFLEKRRCVRQKQFFPLLEKGRNKMLCICHCLNVKAAKHTELITRFDGNFTLCSFPFFIPPIFTFRIFSIYSRKNDFSNFSFRFLRRLLPPPSHLHLPTSVFPENRRLYSITGWDRFSATEKKTHEMMFLYI